MLPLHFRFNFQKSETPVQYHSLFFLLAGKAFELFFKPLKPGLRIFGIVKGKRLTQQFTRYIWEMMTGILLNIFSFLEDQNPQLIAFPILPDFRNLKLGIQSSFFDFFLRRTAQIHFNHQVGGRINPRTKPGCQME